MLDRTTKADWTTLLDNFAQRIDAEHLAVAAALRSALGHAINAGAMLIEAKRHVPHGQWLKWLAANVHVPKRTAAHYMHLARHREVLCDQNGNVLPISVNDALDSFKHPADRGGIEPYEQRHRLGPVCPVWGHLAWATRSVTRFAPSRSSPSSTRQHPDTSSRRHARARHRV
jgi:hypothetical protein